MLSMLIAYDASGNVIATLDYLVARDSNDKAVGLVDFDAYELARGEMTDVWKVSDAAGSKTWPEWLGGAATSFRVELAGPAGNKRLVALVHKVSGYRRVRSEIEAAIAARMATAGSRPADIRDIVGGPDKPLTLDAEGRTVARVVTPMASLPVAKTRVRAE